LGSKGPVYNHLADACVVTKHRKYHVLVPSLTHAYSTDVMQMRRASLRHFKMVTCLLREKTLSEKHRSSAIAGVRLGLTTQPRKMICR
jgi:hypothetical protein